MPPSTHAAARRPGSSLRFKRVVLPIALFFVWLALYLALGPLVDALVFSIAGLPAGSAFTDAVRFFLYETPKVLLLLVLIVFAVGILRSFFSPERTRALLEKMPPVAGTAAASLLGIVTPFCSCSAVPLFVGFVEAGVPLGVTFSFLIAAPMINEVALVLLFGLFGWKTALLYVVAGLAVAISAGLVIGRLPLGRFVEEWVYEVTPGRPAVTDRSLSAGERIDRGYEAVREIVSKVWLYVLLGIAVGSAIHGYVPEQFMAGVMGKSAWWSVPASVLIGIPLYSNAAGIIPIVQALLEKGASLGTVLAFMMSVIGLSLPELIILRKVLKPPLIVVFVGVVAVGILLVGYLFNALL